MRRTGQAMITSLALTCLLSASTAGSCELKSFDQSEPRAVRGEVSNQFAIFEWGSDADYHNGHAAIWNYIWNRSDRGLGAKWEKGRIKVPIQAPIAPGEPFCYVHRLRRASDGPDFDAPIKYGTNNQVQDAAVFVPAQAVTSPAPPAASISSFSTTYLNDKGDPVPIALEVSSFPTAKGFRLQLYRSSGDLLVGISGLPSRLNEKQLDTWSAQSTALRGTFYRATLAKFSGTALIVSSVTYTQGKIRKLAWTKSSFSLGAALPTST